MKKFLLSMALLGWTCCGFSALHAANADRVSREGNAQAYLNSLPQNQLRGASTYAQTDGLVVDYQKEQRFYEESELTQLPQEIFDAVMKLERGTIAIEISTGKIPATPQIILSCGSSDNKEFLAFGTTQNDKFGIKVGYEKGNGIAEDYYSSVGLINNFHQTILITMDPTGEDSNLGMGGFGAYSFYAQGSWQRTTNVSEVPHFGIFKGVKNANALYLGGVKGPDGQKKDGFKGAVHRIRVWNRVLSSDECKSVTSVFHVNGKLLFESQDPKLHPGDPKPYRIPAMTQASNGNLIAVADYRICKDDIGNGDIDLHYRISHDQGTSWGEKAMVLADGSDSQPYGDAAIVADRNSAEVLLLCGSAPNGTTYHKGDGPLKVFRFRSHDYGETWKAEDRKEITTDIYNLIPNAKKLFITSGKITQSRMYRKAGAKYNRIYCVALVKNTSDQEFNAALYSDDFGETWQLLGGSSVWPIPVGNGANEAKIDELPDGSLLLSSRVSEKSGRNFNIYNYTNPETAEGFWSKHAISYDATNGVVSMGNSTNGDILCVPVIRKADQRPMYLLLQSLPFGNERSHVSIFYKPLEDLGKFNIPYNVAKDWEGRYEVVNQPSAYSTMLMQDNHTLGFLYEDGTFVPNYDGVIPQKYKGYNLFYLNLTIGYITDDKYVYDDRVEKNLGAYLKTNINSKHELLNQQGRYVGQQSHNSYANREKLGFAIKDYRQEPIENNYYGINKVIKEALAQTYPLQIEPGHVYRLINLQEKYELAVASDNDPNVQGQNIKNIEHYFTFVPTQQDKVYKIQHLNRKNFIGKTRSTSRSNFRVVFSQSESDAGTYQINSNSSGVSTFRCINPVEYTGEYFYLAPEKSGANQNLIAWKPNDKNWINWYIEPIDFYEIDLKEDQPGEYWASICLPYAVSIPEGTTAYYGKQVGSETDRSEITLSPVQEIVIPAETGVILKSNAPKAQLPIIYPKAAPDMSGNLLQGTLTDQDVSANKNLYYILGKVAGKNLGFYHPKGGKIPRNKAYLYNDSGVNGFSFTFDLTGIDELETTPEVNEPAEDRPVVYYDLSGRRVLHPTHGIYIANGKKIYIK